MLFSSESSRTSMPWKSGVALVLLCASTASADIFSEIRYTDLLARLGANTPTGINIKIGQVEAPENAAGSYAPDTTLPEFAGTTFSLLSGTTAPPSWHGTEVGKSLYGNTLSIAPGVTAVSVWNVNAWLTSGSLGVGSGAQPAFTPTGMRVHNHSWIGSFGQTTFDNEGLRRLDFVANRDNVLFTVGVNNGAGSAPQPLVAYAYNALAVGLADGNHATALTPSGIDGPNRRKPEIVAPGPFTSFSTPVVGAAAALLFDAALTDPAVSSNANANRAITVKAALVAGTTHRAGWSNGAPTSGASRGITTTPLDPVSGADLLNIDRAHRIFTGGERNGSSTPQISTFTPSTGWDYIASQNSGTSSYYTFRVHAPIDEMSVSATWFRQVASTFTSASIQNFDLRLWRVSGSSLASISGEAGVGVFASGNVESNSLVDNIEHLYIRNLAAGDYVLELKRVAGSQTAMPVVVAWYMPSTSPSPDLDGNGSVGASDLAILLNQWGTVGTADLNGDGVVNASDMAVLLNQWG
ncbi:MAG: dockerin type I domain-containing protein [bacterium]